jgi:hypothetical protein
MARPTPCRSACTSLKEVAFRFLHQPSKANPPRSVTIVRCYFNSGQMRVRLNCPLSANSGHSPWFDMRGRHFLVAFGESHSGLDLVPIAAPGCEAKYAATLAIS